MSKLETRLRTPVASGRRGWVAVVTLLWVLSIHSAVSQDKTGSPKIGTAKRSGPANESAFDVVSIRPSGPDSTMNIQWRGPDFYRAQHTPLFTSVLLAYFSVNGLLTHGTADRVLHAPDWLRHDMYDFVGKVSEEDVPAWKNQPQSLPLMQQMVRTALRDRCQLEAHVAMTDGPVYGLVPGKHAPALKAADPNQPDPADVVRLATGGKMVPYRRKEDPTVVYLDISMAEFAANLSNSANRPVVDRTGLTGRYAFSLTKRDTTGEAASDPDASSPWDLEKLGFKLVPMTAPLETVVIDHIEKPTEN